MATTTTRFALALALACAAGACSREEEADGEAAVLPDSAAQPAVAAELAAWDVRFDEPSADVGGFQMAEQPGGGWTIKTGPAGSAITWRDQDMVEGGAFQVSATMEERSAPADHREGYGLFVGGRNLQQPDQQYTYFLVRGNGDFLIKRRDGEATPTLTDWKAAPAVQKVAAEGDVTRNALEIRVQPDSTRFFVNGAQVATLATDEVQPYGVAGLRVNHLLDVSVPSFAVQGGEGRPAAAASAAAGAAPRAADSPVASPR